MMAGGPVAVELTLSGLVSFMTCLVFQVPLHHHSVNHLLTSTWPSFTSPAFLEAEAKAAGFFLGY